MCIYKKYYIYDLYHCKYDKIIYILLYNTFIKEVRDMRRGLAVFNPFGEIERVRKELDSLLESFGVRPFYEEGERVLAPFVDVYETDKEIVVKAELPGVKKEDIDISIKDNVLTIRAERKEEKEEKTEAIHRVERYFGKIERVINLPTNIKPNEAKADYKDGVLEIRFPKEVISTETKIKLE